ncbi:ATP-binding protein [Micrococcus luteus]
MDVTLNPYNPGSGMAPPLLAGRDADIAAFATIIARTKRSRPARSLVFSGLRGVGKTVLLNRLRGQAEAHGWMTVQFEARPGTAGAMAARRALVQGLQRGSLAFRAKRSAAAAASMLATVSSFSVSLGVEGISMGVERDASRASSGSLELDLHDVVEDICSGIRGEGIGLGIFIDEMQDLDDELLQALIVAQHHANQRELPLFVVGTGLPSLPARLAASRSYAERLFEYRSIGRLAREDARASLSEPARQEDMSYEESALELMLDESGCYPYFLQEFGSALWEIAEESPFSPEAAKAAAIAGKARLDAGFFPSRWDRATPAEREYLMAMAEDAEGPSLSSVVADRLGKKIQSLGPVRAGLISKGLIYSPERGQVAFTVPGMAEYILRMSD